MFLFNLDTIEKKRQANFQEIKYRNPEFLAFDQPE